MVSNVGCRTPDQQTSKRPQRNVSRRPPCHSIGEAPRQSPNDKPPGPILKT